MVNDAQEFYDQMIADGVAPKLAEMLALQQPCGTRGTDRALLQGQTGHGELAHMPEATRKKMLDNAKKAGVNISGKTYISGLARHSCDPYAWCDGTGDVVRKAAALGRSTYGVVDYTAPEREPEPKPVLSERIINREVSKLVASDPKNATKDKNELREAVIEKHAPKWKRKQAGK